MLPGDLNAFHRQRRWLIALLVIVPLLLVGAAWWGINAYVLHISEPTDAEPAEKWFAYVIDPMGLPRADRTTREAFFHRHLKRCQEPKYAQEFAAAIRSATSEERERIVTLLWDTFMPSILSDARSYFELTPDRQTPFLDECIFKYMELVSALKATKMGKSDGLTGSNDLQLFMRLVDRLPPDDQSVVIKFWEKMQQRVAEIMADAQGLRKKFEERLNFGAKK